MKPLFFALFLLINGAPLFAGEPVGDPSYIPSYQELVREGYGGGYGSGYDGHGRYGSRYDERERTDYYLRLRYGYIAAPKPTQAYYGKGYTIYYAYTTVLVPPWQTNAASAFGHSVDYFRRLLPAGGEGVDLSNYAVEVRNNTYAPGDYVAQRTEHRGDAVTTVQSVKTTTTTTTSNGTNPLPAVGEKPAH